MLTVNGWRLSSNTSSVFVSASLKEEFRSVVINKRDSRIFRFRSEEGRAKNLGSEVSDKVRSVYEQPAAGVWSTVVTGVKRGEQPPPRNILKVLCLICLKVLVSSLI